MLPEATSVLPLASRLPSSYKEIQFLISEGKTLRQIASDLSTKYGQPFTKSTLHRRITAWKLEQPDPMAQVDDHVLDHFWRGMDDNEIADTFEVIYKVKISERTVRRSRTKQDLIRRMNPIARTEYMKHVRDYLAQVISTSKISRYGIRSVQEHLRTQQISSTR